MGPFENSSEDSNLGKLENATCKTQVLSPSCAEHYCTAWKMTGVSKVCLGEMMKIKVKLVKTVMQH